MRWAGTPSWAGSPGSREGPIDLTPYTGSSAVPSREERTTDWGRLNPPRNMALADDGTKNPRWPGGPWWDGRPSGTPVLRGCGSRVRRRAYLWGLPGVKRNPAASPRGRGPIETRLARGWSRRLQYRVTNVATYALSRPRKKAHLRHPSSGWVPGALARRGGVRHQYASRPTSRAALRPDLFERPGREGVFHQPVRRGRIGWSQLPGEGSGQFR